MCSLFGSSTVVYMHIYYVNAMYSCMDIIMLLNAYRWCMAMSNYFQKKDSDFQPKMPKFLWLLRDMDLSSGSSLPTEWLIQKLRVPKCKEIFEAIANSFSCIECTFLPPPALKSEVLQDIVQRQDQLTPHFNLELEKSKTKILSMIEPKSCECGPFTGFSLASLIEECMAKINKCFDIPSLQRTWKVAVDVQLQQYISKLTTEYENDMSSTLKDLLPIEEGLADTADGHSVAKVHNQIVKKKCSLLESKVASLVPLKEIQQGFWENARHEFFSRLIERDAEGSIKGGKLAPFLHENYRMSKELCTKTYDRFYDEIVASKVWCAIAEGIPYKIAPDVRQFEEQYYKIACGPAKTEVFHQKRTESKLEEKKLKQIPGPIQDLQVTGISFDRIKLTWSKPTVNPAAAHSYEVFTVKEDNSLLLIETTNECHALIKNLKSNHRYTFVIKARNEEFVGNYVSHISIKTTLTTVARSAVGIGTLLACTVGSPAIFPTILTIKAISSIRDKVRQQRYGEAVGYGALLAVAPLTVPFSAVGGIFAAPFIAITAFETTAPKGDLEC